MKYLNRLPLGKKYRQRIWGVLACIARRQECQIILLKVFYFVPIPYFEPQCISLKQVFSLLAIGSPYLSVKGLVCHYL